MTTPIKVFAELAARHGGVDPNDTCAVQNWFMETLPTLPPEQRQELLSKLLDQDGGSADATPEPSYPEQAELPRLDRTRPVPEPRFAAGFTVFLKRFLRRGP